jgi:hypothetical protein
MGRPQLGQGLGWYTSRWATCPAHRSLSRQPRFTPDGVETSNRHFAPSRQTVK